MEIWQRSAVPRATASDGRARLAKALSTPWRRTGRVPDVSAISVIRSIWRSAIWFLPTSLLTTVRSRRPGRSRSSGNADGGRGFGIGRPCKQSGRPSRAGTGAICSCRVSNASRRLTRPSVKLPTSLPLSSSRSKETTPSWGNRIARRTAQTRDEPTGSSSPQERNRKEVRRTFGRGSRATSGCRNLR